MEERRKKELLALARESIITAFEGGMPLFSESGERAGAFVTLRESGHLRGCIGYLAPVCPLERQLVQLARHAAFEDPRFAPLTKEETGRIRIEISLLTPKRRIPSLESFKLGRDGIYMSLRGKSAVFLPQVASETGWDKERLLSALSMKAGLPAASWKDPDAVFETFQAKVFSED